MQPRPVFYACVVLLIPSLASPALSQRYTVADLGALPGDTVSEARALNDQGEVVGNSYATYDDFTQSRLQHPFVWRNGQMTPLRMDGSSPAARPSGRARGINASGQVAGAILQTYANGTTSWTGYKAAVWTGDSVTVLEPGDATEDYAVSINDAGHVAEASAEVALPNGAHITHGWLVKDGQRIPLTDEARGMAPTAVNNADQVAGMYEPGSLFSASAGGYSYKITEHWPAVWASGVLTNLEPQLCCGVYGWAYAMNEAGVVVGSVAAEGYMGLPTATQWGGTDIIGGSTSGFATDAVGINDAGQIIGRGGDTVLWQGGRRRYLKDLIADPRKAPSEVTDINNAGQIAGYRYGSPMTAVLLTPVLAGDADGNGAVQPADLLLVLQSVAGIRTPAPDEAWRADAAPSPSADISGYGDRQLDLRDAVRITRRLSGFETAWP